MPHAEKLVRGENPTEAIEAHLARLAEGAGEWNAWRVRDPSSLPMLSGADLSGRDLSGYDLSEAWLDSANLTNTVLNDASLVGAILDSATLDSVELRRADLTAASLYSVVGSNIAAGDVNLSQAKLADATIHHSFFMGADLRGADLRRADLLGTDLAGARFDGAILWTTQLVEADLRDTTGLRLDETLIRNAKFSPRASDRWSVLRRHYTGPRFAITLLFLAAFAFPYAAKATAWVATARTQELVASVVQDAQARLAQLDDGGGTAGTAMAEVLHSVEDKLILAGQDGWRSVRVWELLLGIDKGPWYFLATLILLGYNVLRGLLTWVVAPMRDAEERSGVSPPHKVDTLGGKSGFLLWLKGGWAETYSWLWIPHKTVTVLFAVAVASFAFHAIAWLGSIVWLPI